MKKYLVVIGLVVASLFFGSNAFAGSWGATQLEYLNADYPEHSDEFSPGCSGTHQIRFWADATYWDKLQVTYCWRSDASPNWTSFQVTQYSSTGYNTVDLYAGSSDVEFKITFQKVDANSSRTMTVSWTYYTND